MSTDYSKMTNEEFDEILNELASQEDLMSIPGVYEIVREHLNNAVLEEWELRQPEDVEVSA